MTKTLQITGPEMTEKTLFDTYHLGNLVLANRIVMAPLTRNRAGAGLVPSELAATYYGQRASAGLLITEATQVSPQAQGYQDTPGLYPGADRWLAQGDGRGACQGRAYFCAALALGAYFSCGFAAGWRCAGRAFGDSGGDQDVREQRFP